MEKLRAFSQNRFVKILFAVFLIIPFGLFGIDYYFKRPVGGDTVASVGNVRIGASEFDQAMRQQAEMYRQQFRGSFDPALMENPEIKRSVLDRLVSEKLVLIGSERARVTVPDRLLADRIASEPVFQVDGKFSKERYEQIAKAQGMTALGLDERLRADFRQQAFRSAIAETAIVPKATIDAFIKLSEQQREVSVVNFTPDAYTAQVKLAPDAAKKHYDANPKEFTIPERARVEYIELSVDALAAKMQAPAAEVKQLYDEGMQRNQWGQPEERKASHVLISVKPDAPEADKKAAQAKAQAIADQVRKKPETFAEVAKKESQDPGSAAQGGDLGFFGRGAMVKPFADAAFEAKKGELVGPVLSEFGYHVIRVTDIKPAKVKSLAEAAPELEAGIKKQLAQRAYVEAADQFTNLVYEQPASLKPTAEKLQLTVQQSPWLTKGQGVPIPALGNPKMQAEIFSADAIKNKRNTSAIEVAPNVLAAAHVIEHKPEELRPFESVRAEIERRLTRDEAVKLARAAGEAKLKDAQAGKEADVKWPAPLAVNRQKPGGLPPPVIDRAFRADPRKLPAVLGVETPMGYTLVKVTKVIEAEKIDDAQRQMLGGQLKQAVALGELETALASLRNRVGVSVSKTAIAPKEGGQAPAK